jgi:Transposase DDE domain
MIMQEALPAIKRFLKPVGLTERALALTIRCVAAFCLHCGRMSAVQAAQAVQSEPRHRAQICRFFGRRSLRRLRMVSALQGQVLAWEAKKGRFVYLTDQTLCSQQGEKTQNTYSTGNRQRRPRKGRRYNKYKHARKRCHCFVMGLLLTPSGLRIPLRRCYYTQEYCAYKGWAYRTQAELAAEMIEELLLPEGADVVVLGDTAFDAAAIRQACSHRQYTWIVPLNPERVLAGAKPRPRVRSLVEGFSAEQFRAIRLYPQRGPYVAMRRLSPYRIGPKVKPRVYYAHAESREVHSVGEVQLVFSTREQPQAGRVNVQKILMTNQCSLQAADVVELYDLRWQIELFFKELKSTLGFDQYRFRRFEQVEGWLELVLVTFLYLEWHRARLLAKAQLSEEDKQRLRRQRTHGLCLAIRQASERADLEFLAEAVQTPGGIRRLRLRLREVFQREYRFAA